MLLVYILIFVFAFLLFCSFYNSVFYTHNYSVIEGLENNTSDNTSNKEYQPYNLGDPNNCLILAQQNAGNIEVLKGRVDDLDGIKKRVDTMQESIDSMQIQMNNLVQQQSDYAQQMAGSTPPDVTGTEPMTTEDVETSIEEQDKIK